MGMYYLIEKETCATCKGAGHVEGRLCRVCFGAGVRVQDVELGECAAWREMGSRLEELREMVRNMTGEL